MNERIQKLAEQAKMSTYLSAYGVEFNISIEKFAELIVQECSSFLKDTLDDHFAAEQLEEHFGVEE
jgi:hypothetical protein